MHRLAKLDHQYVWHPFTQMRDWLRREPLVIVSGRGAILRDVHGREYLDANASIWTNLHGHNHPHLNAALRRQLVKIAHSSALGMANEPASLLAMKLVESANPPAVGPFRSGRPSSSQPLQHRRKHRQNEKGALAKVFYSDDGSTALEVALKLAYEFCRRTGRSQAPRFLSLQGGYHGDTIGAVSLGHIDLFHQTYRGLLFRSDALMAPYCYRCPFNRAKPQRADARQYRHCHWECVDQAERAFCKQRKRANPYAALVVEPLIQGAAGMIAQPEGWLRRVAQLARNEGALLIVDEVMTGFGRTGNTFDDGSSGRLFACHREGVQPDMLALSKGITGGYLPLAATLTTEAVFEAFLGEYEEFKTFFHGHSYTANPLGCATALASLELLQDRTSGNARHKLENKLSQSLAGLWRFACVGDIRQVGLITGIELVRNWRTRASFSLREKAGIRVCEAMARRGVLTRPIGNVIVLMPPYCITNKQLNQMLEALETALEEVFGSQHE
jgi:adenosylmethionine-8-amino-7-oxononanoate aminotransferase